MPPRSSAARVTIEPVAPGDVAEVCAISAKAFDAAPGVAGVMTEANLREELARPWARVWLAREGARIVGFLVVWHVADELHVLNVAVLPERRRGGVGRELMDHALAYAAASSVRHLVLEVRRSNGAAIALYRAMGFHALGLRHQYYSDGEDALEMMAALDENGRVVPRPDEVRLD
jgi:ribosomal-protein-alanine N-acetyltransferase